MAAAVLCVDDDPRTLEAHARLLAPRFAVRIAASGREAVQRVQAHDDIAAVVCDLCMPEMDGIECLSLVHRYRPDVTRLLLTGRVDFPAAQRALNSGAVQRLLTKPVPLTELLEAVRDGVAGYERSVAARRRTEAVAIASAERYQRLFDSHPHAVWVCDAGTGRVLAVNDAAVRLYGVPHEEFLRLSAADFAGAVSDYPCEGRLARHRTARAGERLMSVTANRINVDERSAFVVTALDVTEQAAAEEAIRLRDRAIQAVAQGIVISDVVQDGQPIVYASPGFTRVTGYPVADVLGRNCRFLQGRETDTGAVEQIREAIRRGHACTVELLNYRKDGTTFWNELNLSPVRDDGGRITHYIGVQLDITGRKSLEAQLRRAQRLESLGQLAAGVAHEINTPIQYITDNTVFLADGYRELTDLLDRYRSAGPDPQRRAEAEWAAATSDLGYLTEEMPRAIAQTIEGLRHVSRIVKALKEFAHPGGEERVAVDLAHVLDTAVTLARNEWKYDAEIRTDYAPGLPAVLGLAGELSQVFVNLIVNAAHAIHTAERVGKGTIRITIRAGAGRARVEVADNGCGIPAELRDRVFDPFFTTKPVGQGTGQGLALAHAVVQRHGGGIWFDTSPGEGTTFVVELPLCTDPEGRPGRAAAEEPQGTSPREGVP